MALTKPIAQTKIAFDATEDSTFYFNVSSGDQIVKNKITIRSQSDNTIIYENTVESYQMHQTVPANTLTNGEYYNFYFNTYNIQGEESANSNSVPFYCYTTPTLTITNLSSGDVISGTNQEIIVEYFQLEYEMLNDIIINLYNDIGQLLESSGNIYTSTTRQYSYTFKGLENDESYYVQAFGNTVNGTSIESDRINFGVKYDNPILFSNLNIISKCEEGYNQIISSFLDINGESNKENPLFLRELIKREDYDYIIWDETFEIKDSKNPRISDWTTPTKLSLDSSEDWVKWYQGFHLKEDFVLSVWMQPCLSSQIISLFNEDGDGYIIEMVREIPFDETTPKDYFVLKGYKNGELQVNQKSNYVDLMNNLSYFIIWVKKIGNTYELILHPILLANNVFEWGKSNVEYGKITNLVEWKDEGYEKGLEFIPLSNDMDSIFPIETIQIFNGVYNNININTDTTTQFSIDFPSWTYKTVLNCNFDGNLKGGNTDIVLSQITKLRIKRREKGAFEWITLFESDVDTEESLTIVRNDFNVPSGVTQQYAVVPVLGDGVEGEYIVSEATPKWKGLFINNKNTIFKLYSGVSYGDSSNNLSIGILTAIGNKYPYIVKNGELDYINGNVRGDVLGYSFENTREINTNDAIQEMNDILSVLKDDVITVKDWSGNIWICRMSSNPTISYNAVGMKYPSISFNFVEQGKYNVQKDLYDNNLIDVEV